MRIHETTLLCLNDPYPNTDQVKGGHGQDQDQVFERFGRRELTAVDLLAARFFIAKVFFDVETQTVLIQGPGISGFITHYEPGVIRLVNESG
jgi:hypothetical protein